ncbi:hypothetical protein ScPMuIL_004262 [Solemya velum]
MVEFLKQLKQKVAVALVGGSDLCKIEEQMGELKHFNYVFAENGLVAFKEGVKIGHENILTFVGEEILQKVINFSLGYMSQLTLPAKRGLNECFSRVDHGATCHEHIGCPNQLAVAKVRLRI